MTCPKCSGCLIKEWMFSADEYTLSRPCFKCINCGYRDDLIFSANRRKQYVAQGVTYAKT